MINLSRFFGGGGGTCELEPVLFLFPGIVFFRAMEEEIWRESGLEEPVLRERNPRDGVK